MANLQVVMELIAKDVGATGTIGAVEGALGRMAGISMAALTAGIAGAAAGMGLAVHSAAALEQSVANISTIKPEIDTSAVFASLNEISTRVPQTAKQLGDGLYNIFSSIDVSTEQGLSLVETFAKGAVGASTDAMTFGTAAIGVMNAYGLSAEDAGHVSDVFFNTVNKGVVTGQELAQNLGLVTQSAKLAGVDLDSLGGFIAGITKEGGPAAQNMNNLSNLFQKIDTKEAQAAMHSFGIATTDATGAFRPQIDVLTDLKAKTDLMTESGKAAAIQKIFPDLQARAGAQVIMDQLDFVKASIQENIASSGSAEAAYSKMSATFESQSKLLGNSIQAVATTLGAELLPSLTPVVHAFAEALPGAFATARTTLGTFASEMRDKAGSALQDIADKLAATGTAWAPWAAQAGPAGDAVGHALSGVSGAVEAVQLALQGNFPAAMEVARGAMGEFGDAAAALGRAFDELIPQVARDDIWRNLGDALGTLRDAATELWPEVQKIGGAADSSGGSTNAFAQTLVDLSGAVKEAAGLVRDVITVLIEVGTALDGLVAASSAAGVAIHNEVAEPFIELGSVVQSAMSVISSTVQAGWAEIQSITSSVWQAIPEDIRSDLGIVVGLIGDRLGEAAAAAGAKWAEIQSAAETAWASITAAIGAALDGALAAINGWIGQAVAAMRGMIPQFGAAGQAAGQSAVDGLVGAIRGGIAAVGDAAASLARSALASAKSALGAQSPSKEFAQLGGDSAEGMIIGLKSKNPEVRAAAQEMARQAQIAVQIAAPVDSFIVAGQDMGEGIGLGILRGVPKAQTAAQTMGDSILNTMQSFTQSVASEVQSTTDKLADIATKAGTAVQSALDKENDAIQSAVDRASDSLDRLYATASRSVDTSSRKSALAEQIADEERAHAITAAADEAQYQHQLALSKATTQTQRDSINQSYADAVAASKHKQELDTADRIFKAQEAAKTKALDDQLSGEALSRQIADTIRARGVATAAAQGQYEDTVQKAQLTADTQRLILLRSYTQRIDDLKTRFLDQIPPLEGPALDAFTAFMDNINAQTSAMGTTVAEAFGSVVATAQQAFGDGGDVPAAFNVTDRMLDETAGKSRTVLGAGGVVPSALQTTASTARQTLGIGGTLPTAASQAGTALDSTGQAARNIAGPFDLLKDAAAKLGTQGLQVALNAAKDLEGQFPGLTDAVDAWIATLGGIPKTITTDIVTNFITNGSPAGAGGGGGGGGGGSSSKYAGQGSPGQYTLPNIVTGGSITVSGSNLSDAISNAAKQTGVSVGAQTGGGTFGSNSNSSLSFDEGGWVPGPVGAPVQATVHGGEYVLPAGLQLSARGSGQMRLHPDDIRAIASALAGVSVTASVAVDDVHSGLLRKEKRSGKLWTR